MTNNITRFPEDPRIFSMSRAAHYLGICDKTLRKMTARGEIPSFNVRGHRMYRLEDLDRFIDNMKPWKDRKRPGDGPKAG